MIRLRLGTIVRTIRGPRRALLFPCAMAGFVFLTAAAVTLTSVAQDGDTTSPAGPETQPIGFSHRQHVSGAGLDCQLCHAYARRGPVAGIPSVARCTGCHNVVLPERPEVEKLLAYAEREEPIPWVRIYRLPDHVRFTHKRHVQAGVGCDGCHGDVGMMNVVEQVSPLTMGWCVSCHEAQQVSVDCLTCHY